MIISNNGDRDEILYIEAPEHDLCDSLSAPEFKISCSEKTIVNSALYVLTSHIADYVLLVFILVNLANCKVFFFLSS